MRIVEPGHYRPLPDYARDPALAGAVRELQSEAAQIVPGLAGRRVWMVNSTAQGGGVAEMLPSLVSLLRELGVTVEWAVLETDRPDFFPFTKRLHNLIHGAGDPRIGEADRALYDAVSEENARELRRLARPDDVLVVHDPQPLGFGARAKADLGLRAIWRCHIGVEEENAATRAAWDFLRPYASTFDQAIFSAPEYIPPFLAGRSSIIPPGLDPLSHKNRELHLHKLVGILCDGALAVAHGPLLAPEFTERAQRLQPGGGWSDANQPEELGLLYRPIVTQISRWDRLKGFAPLLQGFARLKALQRERPGGRSPRHQRTLEIVRLVLAGPDPEGVEDDPEAREVLAEVSAAYRALDPAVQADVAVLRLPMGSRKHNALMVNALQRASTIVAQNSFREGFGLTATEAMWKGIPILATQAVGLRHQVRDGLDGRLIEDAGDPEEIARVLDEMLADEHRRQDWGRAARRRVEGEFLIFSQLCAWLRLLAL